jgi:hypothetical protein
MCYNIIMNTHIVSGISDLIDLLTYEYNHGHSHGYDELIVPFDVWRLPRCEFPLSFPKNMIIHGEFRLEEHHQISNFVTDSLKVDILDMMCSNVTSLPKKVHTESYMDVSDTQINELPNDLNVGSWLSIENTGIQKLSSTMKIKKSIYSAETQFSDKDRMLYTLMGFKIR